MSFTENKGVRLSWQERGDGSPVLLIMGHRFSGALWYPLLPALTARHRVIWFDNRGTGDSGRTPHVTVQELADDALAVMDAAQVERAHVFGVSMGGVIALELAMRAPARATSLILGCTGIITPDKPRMPGFLRVLYYLPTWISRLLVSKGSVNKGYGSAASPEKIALDLSMIAKDKYSVRGVIAQAEAVSRYNTTREAVAALAMPALVLHGDEDQLVPLSYGVELAETLPHSRFVKLQGAGHNFLVARGETATQEVLDFLDGVDRR